MAKKALKATRKFGGKVYKKKATHKLKTAAKKSATAARSGKGSARVVKTKTGYTVYTRG